MKRRRRGSVEVMEVTRDVRRRSTELRILGVRMTLEEQVAEAFEEHRTRVYRYLVGLGLAPGAAQETTQEVFLRMHQSLRKGEIIENPRAWIFRVAHNLGMTHRKRESRWLPFQPAMGEVLASPDAGTETRLMQRERMERLRREVESLSPQQRQCLELRAEGLRHREIAEALGVSTPTASESLRRAVARLKKVFHE